MPWQSKVSVGALLLVTTVVACLVQSSAQTGRNSLVIVFTDGHQKTVPVAAINRIEFNGSAMVITQSGRQERVPVSDIVRIDFNPASANPSPLGRNHFIGKWKAGQGNGMDFYITLKPDGEALKSIGSIHGTWVVVNGEAHIAWDDGWHDAIRKVGSKHEKFAYEPGKSFDDTPANVTDAVNLEAQPI
jgi:hypothetical protein